MKRRISIIIPVYGVEPYIEECLRSVASQDYDGPLECIVVDDKGLDKSMDIVDGFISEYNGPIDFKTVIREKNGGLSAARNSGLDAASGDYVYFLDSDDEITSDCISSLAFPLNENTYDVVIGDYRTVGTERKFQKLKLLDNSLILDEDIMQEYVSRSWYQMAVNKLYYKGFLLSYNLRFKDGLIHEDELWSFEIACYAHSLFAVKKEIYIYKIRENSITTNINYLKKAEAFAYIYEIGSKHIKSKKLCNNYYAYMWAAFMFGLAIQNISLADYSKRKMMYRRLVNASVFKLSDLVFMSPRSLKHIMPRAYIILPYTIGNFLLKLLKI